MELFGALPLILFICYMIHLENEKKKRPKCQLCDDTGAFTKKVVVDGKVVKKYVYGIPCASCGDKY